LQMDNLLLFFFGLIVTGESNELLLLILLSLARADHCDDRLNVVYVQRVSNQRACSIVQGQMGKRLMAKWAIGKKIVRGKDEGEMGKVIRTGTKDKAGTGRGTHEVVWQRQIEGKMSSRQGGRLMATWLGSHWKRGPGIRDEGK